MARRQSRRSFSATRAAYDATKQAALARGLTASHLVELALLAYGVVFEPGQHVSRDIADRAAEGKLWGGSVSAEARRERRRKLERDRYRKKAQARGREVRPYRPSLERQMLGDATANAMGFR